MPAYRKIVTRLIVSRPDTTASDGTIQQNALFGTYIWNDTETAATLQQDPLRDGLPFSDRLITYDIDEPRAAAIQASTPSNQNLEYALDTASPPVRRHYAVPGSERCIQCHMGSASASFVLGFLPVQIATHPTGQSGVIEPAKGDELTQLQRLIDYNVITGISSPDDVLPLEKTQLPRTPRNGYELNAQAYMLGNCSHCHNPRGFPTTKAPVLKDLLDFLPRKDGGGIFQFPLDRTSPLRARGVSQDIPIPYITPSLRDIPEPNSSIYKSKYVVCTAGETEGWCTKPPGSSSYIVFVDAPWRSLIYRNTDTPFDYVDDLAIFPHMPMDTPGYDCRVAQIMGDWMVSIPAVNKNVANENTTPDMPGAVTDTTPQPYAEVLPSDPTYASAQAAATKRLAQYHAGTRYNFCPDTSDIVDPDVSSGALQSPAAVPVFDNTVSPPQLQMIADGVPARPHWVVTDLTDPPGPWYPRGYNWQDALLKQIADASGSGVLQADLQTVVNDLPNVYLDDNTKNVLTTPVPFTTWQAKPGCDFSRTRTVGSYQGAERPVWMDNQPLDPNAPVYLQSPGAAVFTNICINCHGPEADSKGLLADEISLMTGGNARVANFRSGLFGPEEMLDLNRTELFSPPNIPANYPASPEDLTARYMAWMALGGTKVQLPPQLLQVVAATQVAGTSRTHNTSIVGSANMLQLARQLCANLLLSDPNNKFAVLGQLPGRFPVSWSGATPLIDKNGDAETWMKICTLNNRPVIHVLVPGSSGSPMLSPLSLNPQPDDWNTYWSGATGLFVAGTSLYYGTDGTGPEGIGAPVIPSGSPLMDQRGELSTADLASSDNLFPMCVREPPAGSDAHAAADALLQRLAESNTGGNVIPYCPSALFAAGTDANGNGILKWRLSTINDSNQNLTFPDANKWALRGAINAGLAVFLYIDQLSQSGAPQPLYNQCDLLSSAGARAQP